MPRKLSHSLTKEQYRELGERLHRAHDELLEVLHVIYKTYGVSNRAAVTLEKTLFTGGKLDVVRMYLLDRCADEHGDTKEVTQAYLLHWKVNQ